MPFTSLIPHAFNLLSVRAYAPPFPGIYGLSNASNWVYIGKTDNIQQSLLGILEERNSELQRSDATGFVFELCPLSGQDDRCTRLVTEYDPRLSKIKHH